METPRRLVAHEGSLRAGRWRQKSSDLRRIDFAVGSVYARLVGRPLLRVVGRLLTIGFMALLLLAKWQAVTRLVESGNRGGSIVVYRVILLNYALQVPFLALAAFLVVLRRPQRGGVVRLTSVLAALAGTLIPSFLVLDNNARASAALLPVCVVLLAGGMSWAICSVATLGRCFGVVPEARGLVTRGPYRWIRHPVYLGEITATLGLLLPILSIFHAAVFAVFVVLQLQRTKEEESVLASTFPEYDAYRLRTRRMIPGIW